MSQSPQRTVGNLEIKEEDHTAKNLKSRSRRRKRIQKRKKKKLITENILDGINSGEESVEN